MALQSPGRYSSIGSPSELTAAAVRIAWPAWLEAIGIVLVAGLLRIVPWLADYPLHRDEALYGYWARLIATGQDPLLLTPWIDKPPLSIYLIAGSFASLGVSELTLRLPGLVASVLTVPALYALARHVYGHKTARLAAGLFALSPFAILFAPTAFTDPWLTLWLVVGAWAAFSGRGLVAGLAAGLAVASKQQGVLVGPLLIALLLAPARPDSSSWRDRLRDLLVAMAGFALVFGPLTWWDSLRWHNRPSFWDRSLTTYGPLVVAPPALWPARAADWAEQLGYLFGFSALSWVILALAALAGGWALRDVARRTDATCGVGCTRANENGRRSLARSLPVGLRSGASPGVRIFGTDKQRVSWATLILAGYAAGYLVLHLVVTFQPWDRYLLPLVPLVCLLAAQGLTLTQMLMPQRRKNVAQLLRSCATGRSFSEQMSMLRPAPRWMKMQRSILSAAERSRRVRSGRPVKTASFGCRLSPSAQDAHVFSEQMPMPQREVTEDKNGRLHMSPRMHKLPVAPFVYSWNIRGWQAAVLAVALGLAAWLGAAGRIPVGSDHGAYTGIRQVAAFLREQPAETVIYHQSLGWYFDFYLFDAPQERRWFDTPEKLADEATRTIEAQPTAPQWLVVPAWEADRLTAWRPVLTAHGLMLTDSHYVYRPDNSRSFEMYRIVPKGDRG